MNVFKTCICNVVYIYPPGIHSNCPLYHQLGRIYKTGGTPLMYLCQFWSCNWYSIQNTINICGMYNTNISIHIYNVRIITVISPWNKWRRMVFTNPSENVICVDASIEVIETKDSLCWILQFQEIAHTLHPMEGYLNRKSWQTNQSFFVCVAIFDQIEETFLEKRWTEKK